MLNNMNSKVEFQDRGDPVYGFYQNDLCYVAVVICYILVSTTIVYSVPSTQHRNSVLVCLKLYSDTGVEMPTRKMLVVSMSLTTTTTISPTLSISNQN